MPRLLRLLPAALSLVLVAPALADGPARKDAFGDPLPDGAVLRLGTARFRVNGPAHLAPDGKLIAVIDQNAAVRLLDAAEGTEVHRIEGERLGYDSLTFSPRGDVLAVRSSSGVISFWDPATGKSLGRIEAVQNNSCSLAFSADGKTLLVAPQAALSNKAVLHAYEVPGGKEIGTYNSIHENQPGVAVTADGKTAASWGGVGLRQPPNPEEMLKLGQTVQLWDVIGGKELRRIETDRGGVMFAAFSPDGTTLALACFGGYVQLWGLNQGNLLRSFVGLGGSGRALMFSPDGKTLLSSGTDGRVLAWDVPTGRRLHTAEPPAGVFCSAAFPGGGKILACSQNGQELRVWEVWPGKPAAPRVGHADKVAAVAFTADGAGLWSAGEDGELILWDAASGKELRRLADPSLANGFRPLYHRAGFVQRLSPGARYLLWAGAGDYSGYSLRETATNQEVLSLPVRTNPSLHGGAPVAFSPDGSMVGAAEASAGPADEENIYFYNPDSGKELFALKGFKGRLCALAVSPDGQTLALGRYTPPDPQIPPEVFLWTLGKDKAPRSLGAVNMAGTLGLCWLGYSPDGRVLAAGDGHGNLAVWDAATGRDRWKTPHATDRSWAPPAFSADGRLLADASTPFDSEEGRIRIWEVGTGRVRREFSGRFGLVTSLAFSPDGKTLAAGCRDTTILLWDAAAGGVELKKSLKAEEMDALWADLASPDAAPAGRAVEKLAAAPADAVPYLKKRVSPIESQVDEAAIGKLVADLDSDDFDVREKAQRRLADLGAAAAPALRKALDGEPSAEVKQRAGALLAKLAAPDLSPETLRLRRAVEALERIGDPAARDCLEVLAKGRPGADVTEHARAALKRLDKRQ